MAKWQKTIVWILGIGIILFLLFATIDNIAGAGMVTGLGAALAKYWLGIIILAGLAFIGCIGGFILWLISKERAEKAETAQEIRMLKEEIRNSRKPQAVESEQGAIYDPNIIHNLKREEEIGKEADLKGENEIPPPPPSKKRQTSKDEPSPVAEAGLRGILNELKVVSRGNRRIFLTGLITLLILLLLTLGFGLATYKFWARSNYFKAQSETLSKLVQACTDTNAFYNILNKQQELMMKFGIPIPETIDPKEVAKWNVDAMFENLYCQFRGNQEEVDKNYQHLLPKFPQAQKCNCEVGKCTSVSTTKPDKPITVAPEQERPKPVAHFCGDGRCNSDEDEDEDSCVDDCSASLPTKSTFFCGDGICQSNENYSTCSDCDPPPKEESGTPVEPMEVYPGCHE